MASNSKKRRRVLGASCILAALIIASSSFAWFSSKDEVTNRLSATSDYSVTIAEDFTPPENWLPGQEINKDVGAVNTGNVDAFVRMWLEGEMNVLHKINSTTNATAAPTSITAVTDPALAEMGLKYKSDNIYYKVLTKGKTEIKNPGDSTGSSTDQAVDDDTYSEVKAVQAGGWLAYATTGAAFNFKPEQGYTYANASGNGETTVAAETIVESSSIADSWTNGRGLAIDSDTFTPTESGLYIFRRNINNKSTSTSSAPTGYDYEYSGYYFDKVSGEYFALEYKTSDNSDYVLDPTLLTLAYSNTDDPTSPVVSVTPGEIKLFMAKYTELKNSDIKWIYDATAKTLSAVYVGADGKYKAQLDNNAKKDYSADDITVVVQLDDVAGATNETWTPIMEDGSDFKYYADTGNSTTETTDKVDQNVTFYYKNDVEEGDTTAKLVDSVTLSSDTKKEAFLAFDFDLNIRMDSIQVTKDATGNEDFETVKTGWASDNTNVTVAKAEATKGAPEINTITWVKN